MEKEQSLKNFKVVLFENRLAETLCELVRIRGGEPVSAPCMREVPLDENKAALTMAEKLLKNEIDVVIFLTGVGARAFLAVAETRYPKEEILEALRKVTVVPRGPKPIRVLKEWNVPYALTVPEPNTWRELLATLDAHTDQVVLKGKTVALQEYGVSNKALNQALEDRGAKLIKVPVYRWALPENLAPLKRAICDILYGQIQIAVFTTAVQVEHLFQVAQEMRIAKKLKETMQKMVIASVGPDCREAILASGLPVDIEPESPKMGPLVTEIAQKARFIYDKKSLKNENCALDTRRSILAVTSEKPLSESLFLKACALKKTERTPVWLMRQAGRYMEEYRKIRDANSFLTICKDTNLITEITVTAQERLDVDAAIIFSDILLLVEAFGLGLDYVKGGGPTIHRPIRSLKDVQNLPKLSVQEALPFVFESIALTRRALKGHIPLLGFAGAPFTLASYMIEGGSSKDFSKTKTFMIQEKEAWNLLLEKITQATIAYLNAQGEAGVQAVQIFDSWVGHLSPYEYETYVLRYSKKVFEGLAKDLPSIHFGTGTGTFLELFSSAGASVISVDHSVSLGEAWKKIGAKKAIQGNLDPKILLSDIPTIEKHVRQILKEAEGRAGHIFNLGHGVLPETPVENVIACVQMVKEYSAH